MARKSTLYFAFGWRSEQIRNEFYYFSQSCLLFQDVFPRTNKDRFVVSVEDFAGEGGGGLFDKANAGIVHGDVLPFPALGVFDGEGRRLLDRTRRGLRIAAAQDHMAAVHGFDVEPKVVFMGSTEGELVILEVAAAGEDVKPLVGAHGERCLGLFLFRGFAVPVFEDAGGDQLGTDVGDVAVGQGAGELFLHARNIVQLRFGFRDQVLQVGLGGFELVVLFIELCGVGLRGEERIERDGDGGGGGVEKVLTGEGCLPALQSPDVGGDQVGTAAEFLTAGSVLQLDALGAELFADALFGRGERGAQLLAAAAVDFFFLAGGIVGIEKGGEGREIGRGEALVTGGRGEIFRLRRETVDHAGGEAAVEVGIIVTPVGAVDNQAVGPDEDNVGFARNHLDDELLLRFAAEIVKAREADDDEPVKPRLLERVDECAGEMLAQQHAEERRLGRVFIGKRREVDARLAGRCREQEAAVFAGGAHREKDEIARGLLDFVDPAAGQFTVQLFTQAGDKGCVDHGSG